MSYGTEFIERFDMFEAAGSWGCMCHRIVLDPTLFLRQRGIQWMRRTRHFKLCNVLASGTLLDKSWSGDADGLACFESRSFWSSGPKLLYGLNLEYLPIRRIDTNYFCRAESAVCAQIAGETFSGVLDGGILAARRLATMQVLMDRYDVEVRLRGERHRGELAMKVLLSLGDQLGEALLRRCRYLAEAHLEGTHGILTVIDGGVDCAR